MSVLGGKVGGWCGFGWRWKIQVGGEVRRVYRIRRSEGELEYVLQGSGFGRELVQGERCIDNDVFSSFRNGRFYQINDVYDQQK